MPYTNSGLVTYTRLTSHMNSPREHVIDTITIHCMAGHMSGKACADYFADTERGVSSNYCIGDTGDIALSVNERDRSWCTSNRANDHRAITIEVSSDSSEPYAVTDAAYEALIKLCTDICSRNGISSLVWSTSKTNRVNHYNGCNMTVHRDYAEKSCPGNYLYNRMGDIASKVNNNLSAGVNYGTGRAPTDSELSSEGYESTSSAVSSTIAIDPSKIKPYIAIVDRNSRTINFESISTGRFVGVLIELGDASLSTTINPKLGSFISDANEHDVPYGLYIRSAVSSKEDVKSEIKKFSIYIRKFPSKLGIWINFRFTSDVKSNDAILDAYREQLELMGFKNKMGIYTDKSQLSKISWKEQSEHWYLHLIEHVASTSELDGILDPSFFSSGVT